MQSVKRTAILLLGPTGSGKTPLGDLMESRGLGGRRCVHFDFGENLRQVAEPEKGDSPHLCEAPYGPFRQMGTVPFFNSEDIIFCREVLRSGALLEDKDFPVAERILRRFFAWRDPEGTSLVVLNGLPRHVDQARRLEAIVDVRAVVFLQCSPETAMARIRGNTGGDRTGRADDDPAFVAQKIATFRGRTEPLLDYYRSRQRRIVTLEVTPEMTAADMLAALETGDWWSVAGTRRVP